MEGVGEGAVAAGGGSREGEQVTATRAVKGGGRMAVTERDREIARWIGRVGVAEARQVAARWQRERLRQNGAKRGLPQSNAYRRLRVLESLGLLERRRLLHAEPAVFLATAEGLRLAELDLRARKVSAGGLAHATEATWLSLALEDEFGEDRVVTEREIRASDAAADRPTYAIEAGGRLPGGRLRLHFPDFAIADPAGGKPLCIELELSAKARGDSPRSCAPTSGRATSQASATTSRRGQNASCAKRSPRRAPRGSSSCAGS